MFFYADKRTKSSLASEEKARSLHSLIGGLSAPSLIRFAQKGLPLIARSEIFYTIFFNARISYIEFCLGRYCSASAIWEGLISSELSRSAIVRASLIVR